MFRMATVSSQVLVGVLHVHRLSVQVHVYGDPAIPQDSCWFVKSFVG